MKIMKRTKNLGQPGRPGRGDGWISAKIEDPFVRIVNETSGDEITIVVMSDARPVNERISFRVYAENGDGVLQDLVVDEDLDDQGTPAIVARMIDIRVNQGRQ